MHVTLAGYKKSTLAMKPMRFKPMVARVFAAVGTLRAAHYTMAGHCLLLAIISHPAVVSVAGRRVENHVECKFEVGVAYGGGARAHVDGILSEQACCDLCFDTGDCAAAVYVASHEGNGTCWLKPRGALRARSVAPSSVTSCLLPPRAKKSARKNNHKGNNNNNNNALDLGKLQDPGKRPSAATCAIVRDENRYLEEWGMFHLALGFGKIYIYDNSDHGSAGTWPHNTVACTNNTMLEQGVHVHPFPTKNKGRQLLAYRDCVKKFGIQHT